MSVAASTLVGAKNLPVKVMNKEVPEGGTGWYTYQAHKFPIYRMILEKVEPFGNKAVVLTYFSNKGKSTAVVPSDFQIEEIKGKDKTIERLWLELGDEALRNLENELTHTFYVGADPEIFIEDENGQVFPAFEFLGSKEKPNRGREITNGGNPVYWDGFQAEFTTRAQKCLAWHTDSVYYGLESVYDLARKKNPKARLSAKTVMNIPETMLREAADEHVAFGCTPSLNAYGIETEIRDGRDVTFRPAGGHIHFGMSGINGERAVRVVKALDAILGVACVSLFEKFDDPRRRTLYGLPGEYRLPAHGLEYRVLSNAWLFHPLITHIVFDIARKVAVFGDKNLLKHWKGSEEETIEVIKYCDAEKAREILKRNETLFKKIIKSARGYYVESADIVFNIFMNGMESVIADPTAIAKNWHVESKSWLTHSNSKGACLAVAHPYLRKGEKL